MFDYTSTQSDVTNLLTEIGQYVTFSRQGTTLFKTYAVFTTSKEAGEAKTPQISGITTTVVGTGIAYIPGNVKSVPLPSDNIVGTGRSYNVLSVEAYKPAGTVLGYKLEIQ